MKKEKQNFSVGVSITDKQNDTGSFDATITLSITDDGKPFCNASVDYLDIPAETLDACEALFTRKVGTLPYSQSGLSEQKMLKLERSIVSIILDLNDFGSRGVGKTRDDKVKEAKRFLKSTEHKRSK